MMGPQLVAPRVAVKDRATTALMARAVTIAQGVMTVRIATTGHAVTIARIRRAVSVRAPMARRRHRVDRHVAVMLARIRRALSARAPMDPRHHPAARRVAVMIALTTARMAHLVALHVAETPRPAAK